MIILYKNTCQVVVDNYYIFDTEETAMLGQDVIFQSLNIEDINMATGVIVDPQVTISWDIPRQRNFDGAWCVAVPDTVHANPGVVIEVDDGSWFT